MDVSSQSGMKINTKNYDFMQKYDKIEYIFYFMKGSENVWHSYGVDVLQRKQTS